MPSPNHNVLPPHVVDERGRLIPLNEDATRERNAEAIRALDEIAEIADETDTDEVWVEVYRGIDEARPHRHLFEGQY